MHKKFLFAAAIFSFLLAAAKAQEVVTAGEYFDAVSQKYASIKDYTANASITAGKKQMQASLTYLAPDKMRMDFSNPAKQVILFNGEILTVYLPGNRAILTQGVAGGGGGIGTSEGLALMRRYYSVSYESGQKPVTIEGSADDEPVQLVLWRRTVNEAFRYIKLFIDPSTKMILRLEAATPTGVAYKIDFSEYKTNQNISSQQFDYDLPSGARTFNNFIFSQ